MLVRFPDVAPITTSSDIEPAWEATDVPARPCHTPAASVDPVRSALPPKDLPSGLRDVIAAAYRRRAELAAASTDVAAARRPMWELTAALGRAVAVLAMEPGEVAIRLCELPGDAAPEQVWARVRTAPRADAWEYSHEHHHCVRVGDWSPYSL